MIRNAPTGLRYPIVWLKETGGTFPRHTAPGIFGRSVRGGNTDEFRPTAPPEGRQVGVDTAGSNHQEYRDSKAG
ncbi:hypothetical protein SCMC78_65300 [Streptomyces sp. CMC78]|uniref:Uncharacterized protein n=1 Tax=Streptomyces sp. CMC78 TaxID=3231512 RepID=A0AB33KSY1_9ACTN